VANRTAPVAAKNDSARMSRGEAAAGSALVEECAGTLSICSALNTVQPFRNAISRSTDCPLASVSVGVKPSAYTTNDRFAATGSPDASLGPAVNILSTHATR
jgi:hypothetical protein